MWHHPRYSSGEHGDDKSLHDIWQALYDAFNPEARKYYWDLMDRALFKIGVDAWWLDTTEPETEGREESILVHDTVRMDGKPASGARYANLFPLMTTTAVYQGQRAASDQKRVFILSRSAFAGAQRNAAAVWSGDPKVKIFKDTMQSTYYDGYKGPISTATGAIRADYVLVQMCAAVATGAQTPEAAAAEAEQRAKRYFRRQDR